MQFFHLSSTASSCEKDKTDKTYTKIKGKNFITQFCFLYEKQDY